MIRIGALLAVATAVTVKREEPSLTEKAAHILKHPIETLTGDTPHEPKTMKDVCPECNKDRQPPLGEHVKHIIEEAAKTGHESWDAVKDKTAEIIESPIETAKQVVNSYRQPFEDSLGGGSIIEIVRNVKEKVVGGADSSTKSTHDTPQTGGAWETLTEGVGSVKDKILGVEATSKEKDRYASHYPKAMEEQAGGVWHTVKEGMHQASNRASEALNELTSETANTRHDEAHPRTRRNVELSPESVERMKDVCPECHKHDKEPTALETATQPLKDLKHTVGAIKDDVTSGVADIVADTAYGVRRGAEGVASVASDAVHGVKRGAEGVASVASDAVHGAKRGAEGVASRSAESVASEAAHGVRRGAEGVASVASDAVHGVKRGVEGVTSAASDAAHDLRHETEQVGKRATDAAHHLRHEVEDAAHKASETVTQPLHDLKSGAAGAKSKIADAVPDMSWSERAGAIKDKVVDTVTKPFQSLKEDAEDVTHRATDTEDATLQAQVDRGIPHHWYSNMMAIKESIDQQFQEVAGNIGKGDGLERVSFVQQNMDKVGNSWVSYMNDNGDEHLDVQLDDADAKSFDSLKALNAARHSNGMPARANLDGVKVQIHRREKPHYYLRTTRILPNGSWTQYENDNGVELVTEGHISKKGVTESAPEKTRPDKHPLLNMFRRTLGLSELADK